MLEGEGEAWLQGSDELVRLKPGVTLVLPPHVRHWFRATGDRPLTTYGVHASPHRIVNIHDEQVSAFSETGQHLGQGDGARFRPYPAKLMLAARPF